MRRPVITLIAVGVVAVGLAGWATVDRLQGNGGRIMVHVGVNACVASECAILGIPDATVTVKFSNGTTSTGKTDSSGTVELAVRDASGPATVTARSALLSEEITHRLTPDGRGSIVVDLVDPKPVQLTRSGGS